MKQTVLSLAAVCMFAALYDQILQGQGSRRAVRMALALEICRCLFLMMKKCISILV